MEDYHKEKEKKSQWLDRKKFEHIKRPIFRNIWRSKKGGEYIVEDDGSELTVQSGQTSIYITYTKKQ